MEGREEAQEEVVELRFIGICENKKIYKEKKEQVLMRFRKERRKESELYIKNLKHKFNINKVRNTNKIK